MKTGNSELKNHLLFKLFYILVKIKSIKRKVLKSMQQLTFPTYKAITLKKLS